MPDRVIRDELLDSDRWLGLKDDAAAIQAGFRKRMISVPATDLTAAIRILCKHYDLMAIIDVASRERPDWKGRKNA